MTTSDVTVLSFADAILRDDTLTPLERFYAVWDHVASRAANDPVAGNLDTAAIFEMPPVRRARRFEVALVVAS